MTVAELVDRYELQMVDKYYRTVQGKDINLYPLDTIACMDVVWFKYNLVTNTAIIVVNPY